MVIGTFHLFDETRSSLLSSSSVVKVHHSFGRAHEKQVVHVPERGVRLERSSRWPRTGGIRRWDCQWYVVHDGPVKSAGPRVEPRRLELLTPSLQRRCSTS